MDKSNLMEKKRFEDFVNYDGTDVFDKAFVMSECLRQSPESMLDGLGLAITESAKPQVNLLDGSSEHQVIMLGSNSYLNLTTAPTVVKAANEACSKYGYGMGAVSLYTGLTDLHKQLEKTIADFYEVENAMVFPSGYGTNIGVISAICGKNDIIINDSANHASIFDGSLLSGAELKIFPHRNMKRLQQVLSRLPQEKGKLIITDGVFSMHGDLAPLDEIVDLAKVYNARLMVDDAHGVGIVGPTGRGTAQAFGVMDRIDLHVGMLSKAPGGLGGYCAGTKEVIQYLRLYARSYFFSTALPAPTVAGLIEVFKLLSTDQAGRKQLWENVTFLKSNLKQAGFDTGSSESGIIPIIVGDEQKLASFHRELVKNGVYTNIVTYPAVRRKEARVRLCVMSTFSQQQMDKALEIIIQAGKKCQII